MLNPIINKQVIKTLVIQHHIATGRGASVSMVANCLQCSKPTASKFIEDNELFEKRFETYRANINKIIFAATEAELEEYRAGKYKSSYTNYLAYMMGGK